MLYIIGGASRAGKSTISRELMAETGIPCFSLDILMMGMANGLPKSGVNPDDPEFRNAGLMWPVLRSMLVNILETESDYIIEGYTILPEHAAGIQRLFPEQVRACFIGYTHIDPDKKLKEIREYSGLPNDWAITSSDGEVLELIERSVRYSAYLESECKKYDIPYFDQSEDFPETTGRILAYLSGQDPDRSILQKKL
jgi:2-phosphoglycerate kinase